MTRNYLTRAFDTLNGHVYFLLFICFCFVFCLFIVFFLLDCVRFLCDNYPLIGECEAQGPLEDVVAYGQGIPPGGSLAWLPCLGQGITKQRSKSAFLAEQY